MPSPQPGSQGVPLGGRLRVTWPGGERTWPLARRRVHVGRQADNDIVIPFPTVSGHHAVVEWRGDRFWCVDAGSRHGLVVDGRRVAEVPLLPGQTIRIGDGLERSVSLRYETGGVEAAVWRPTASPVSLRGRGRWRIGRHPDSDIPLRDDHVSAWHAEVAFQQGAHVLTDLGSTNGTFVNAQPIGRRTLAPGDVIQVGRSLFRYDGQSLTPGAIQGGPAPSSAATDTRVLRVDGDASAITIGRAAGSGLVLDHPMVSRRHARVVRRRDAVWLEDVGSQNGTFVNGRRVRHVPIQQGDRIQIGPFRLTFDGRSVVAQNARHGLRLDGFGLRRQVKTKKGMRTLLDDVTISVLPGEFVALVGGSGTGKSTLLKALSGFEPAVGRVILDGEDLYRSFDAFRHEIGYVPQSDIVHRGLPVISALRYAAALRLPALTDAADREARIADVLALTGIAEQRDSMVSDLSGGQLKRVSTAVELLAKPRVLFLDEPTSGLDPGLDKLMMETFRDLARDGRTVVLVTHVTANLAACDKVAFMADGGRLVYYGPPDQAVAYFRRHAPQLDEDAIDDFADIYTVLAREGAPQLWARTFRQSGEHREYVADREEEVATGLRSGGRDGVPRPRSVGAFAQLGILVRRYFELMVRDWRNLGILIAQAPIIGGLLLLVADGHTFESGYLSANLKSQTVVNAMAIVATWFGLSNAAREITKELPIYRRERMANLGIVPYVLSKIAVLSILCVLQTAILLALVLWRASVPDEGLVFGAIGDLYVTMLLTSLAGVAMGLLLSACVGNEDRAMSMTPILLVPQMLLSGVMFGVEGGKGYAAKGMLTFWSTHAMGSVVDICRLARGQCGEGGRIGLDYDHAAATLVQDWGWLAMYAAVFVGLTILAMRRKDALK